MEIEYLKMENQDSLIAFLVYGIIFTVTLTFGIMLFFYYSRKKIVAEQLSKIELQLKLQKDMVKAIIATQEEERKRIAQDMHDAISAKLNVVGLTANMLLDDDALTTDQHTSLNHILNVTNNTLSSARRIAHDLLPPVLDKFGLKTALEELVEDFLKTNKIQILYTIEDFPNLSSSQSLHIFRIIQEMFNNAIRHGGATQVTLKLTGVPEGFNLSFADNGCGFDTSIIRGVAGLGLENIKSRASILNAELNVKSELDNGCVFTLKSIKNGN